MKAAATSNIGQEPEPADHWSVLQYENEALEVRPATSEINRIGIFDEIDRRLLILSRAATVLGNTQAFPVVTKPGSALLGGCEFVVPSQNERWVSNEPRIGLELRLVIVIGALLIALGVGWFGGSHLYRYFYGRDELIGGTAINAVVERIINVESNGNTNAENSRSSAKGPGQFLNETWLDLMRTYRPDLIKGRSEKETLELRREAKLAREITTRFVEQNATMLRQRGLPVTAGTVYLAHFAGGAGAVAILSAPANADAALVMASADASGRTKREKIIKANPFLEHFTIADLKIWADRKMRGPSPHLADIFTTIAKK